VCTHNSARSQMAEALLRKMAGDQFYVASAGATPTRVHPLAEQVMAERGVSLLAIVLSRFLKWERDGTMSLPCVMPHTKSARTIHQRRAACTGVSTTLLGYEEPLQKRLQPFAVCATN
jgi:protein-tyrosine-phosphatase